VLLKSQANQGTSLFTSAAMNQRRFSKRVVKSSGLISMGPEWLLRWVLFRWGGWMIKWVRIGMF